MSAPALGPSTARGFTLLEILIVVFLIGLVSSVVAPRLVPGTGIEDSARVIAAELRYTAQRATATGEIHRLSLDLEEQRFRIEHRAESEPEPAGKLPGTVALLDLRPPASRGEFEPIPTQQGNWRRLREAAVVIGSVQLGENEVTDDVVYVGFAAEGGSDPAEIRLVDENGARIRIRVLPFTGEVRVEEIEDA